METDIIPLGERARKDILAHVRAVGDAAETNYLEAKSTLDLTSTQDKAKVAKFLLSAANRLPRQAERYFRGYAVMIIGAEKGRVDGVPRGTEAHELADKLRPYLGPQFPGFEFGRIILDDDREVLFITALPPQDGQPIFPCHKDFQGENPKENLADGAIYVRGLSNTETARAGRVLALVERARGGGRPPISLEIEVLGSINRVEQITETMKKLYALAEEKFTTPPDTDHWMNRNEAILPRPIADRITAAGSEMEEEREESLKKWKREKPKNMEHGRAYLLGLALPGAGLRVISHDRSIAKPRLTITFHDCEAFDYKDIDDADFQKLVAPIIRPRQQFPYVSGFDPSSLVPRGYPVSWSNVGDDVEVVLTPESLRPNDPWKSGQNDYVLVTRDPQAEMVSATWVLTEEGNDKATTGTLQITPGAPFKAQKLIATVFS